MSNDFRNNILLDLQGSFTPMQLKSIDTAIAKAMIGFKIEKEETLPEVLNQYMPFEIQEFLIRKEIKGCSHGTICRYKEALSSFALWIKKDVKQVSDIDILCYLHYKETHSFHKELLSKRTIEGQRRILSSFYSYMHDTGKITVNPMKMIDPIKYKSMVRQPLNDIELELVRNACVTLRERAIFEVLYATGGRVSEIQHINYNDIDFDKRRILITGKGDKERYIYFNAKAIIAIQNYLNERTDSNPALFVTIRNPHHRLGKNSIEKVIRDIGIRSGIKKKLFPHLLRHTFATDSLMHGARIEEVQKMLGHACIDTTRIYAQISDEDIRYTYRKCHVG